jgi:hypothetical protein
MQRRLRAAVCTAERGRRHGDRHDDRHDDRYDDRYDHKQHDDQHDDHDDDHDDSDPAEPGSVRADAGGVRCRRGGRIRDAPQAWRILMGMQTGRPGFTATPPGC